ncbi:MAG: tRNA adenosine(34) deaminase TadA [Enterobacteriaceae bacterium PC38]|nr:MAG: tRNA adenosine(34) deaminase TadA [Enterobacteriaceae bacterium PC38]
MKYNHLYWMNKVYKLSINAFKNKEIPVASILVFKNKIINKSYNQTINKNDPTAHAEIIVLRKSGKFLKKNLLNITMYVTLEPCLMCIGAIYNSKIKNLVYGASCNKIGSINFLKNIYNNIYIKNKIKIISGILTNKCSKILKIFFK